MIIVRTSYIRLISQNSPLTFKYCLSGGTLRCLYSSHLLVPGFYLCMFDAPFSRSMHAQILYIVCPCTLCPYHTPKYTIGTLYGSEHSAPFKYAYSTSIAPTGN